MPSTGHFPPSSRPDERYRAVLARGAQLQRRDRMRKGLVTGGAALAVVLLVVAGVLALGGGAAEDGQDTANSDDRPTTTALSDELTVTATSAADVLDVDVDDPVVDIADATTVCVHVRLQGEGPAEVAEAEGSSCWSPSEGDALTEAPLPLVTAEIGCSAATVERPDPDAPTTTTTTVPGAVHHSFRFTLPEGLEPGTHVAEVAAVVGTGDGCPTATPGDDEDVAVTKATVEAP